MLDFETLAVALGLPKDTPGEKVLAAAGERLMASAKDADTKGKQLSAIAEQLSTHGFVVKEGKVEKLSTTEPKDTDSPEVKELKSRLAAQEFTTGKQRLDWAKAEAERLVKEGKVPAAMSAKLEKLFSVSGQAHAVALSQDGASLVKSAVDVTEALREVLNAVPSINATRLSRYAAPTDEQRKESQALSAKGKEVARRVSGRKEEPAGTK